MDYGRHANVRLRGQGPLNLGDVRELVFLCTNDDCVDPIPLGNGNDAVTIGAVDDDQQLAFPWHGRRNHRFDGIRAASLHQDALITGLLREAGNMQQSVADSAKSRR